MLTYRCVFSQLEDVSVSPSVTYFVFESELLDVESLVGLISTNDFDRKKAQRPTMRPQGMKVNERNGQTCNHISTIS